MRTDPLEDDGTVRVATEAWPIVIVVVPRRMTEGAIERMFAEIEPLYSRGAPYALITDTRRVASIPGARERRCLAEQLARPVHVEGQERWNVGSATILDSALLRGAMQAMYWLWTPPKPHCPARDFAEAWTFCVRLLAERRIALPEREADLRAIAARVLER